MVFVGCKGSQKPGGIRSRSEKAMAAVAERFRLKGLGFRV